jgi:hypothetical protein
MHAVLDRRDGLARQIRGGRTVGPLVHTSVRRFIHERQQREDPIGASVYRHLREVLEVHAADYRVELTGPWSDRAARVRLNPAVPGPRPSQDLNAILEQYRGLPALLTALGGPRCPTHELGVFIGFLRDQWFGEIRVRDLVYVLANLARLRHGHVMPGPRPRATWDPEIGAWLPAIFPDAAFEQADVWMASCRRFEDAIRRSGHRKGVRQTLSQVFRTLVRMIEAGDDRANQGAIADAPGSGEVNTVRRNML